MLPDNCCIVIPAIKKNTAFTNDLVKKLAGVSLLQRAINKAKLLACPSNILVLTDSEEITTICKRNMIRCYYDRVLRLSIQNSFEETSTLIGSLISNFVHVLFMSAYNPLLGAQEIENAFHSYLSSDSDILIAVYKEPNRVFYATNCNLIEVKHRKNRDIIVESRSFQIIKFSHLGSDWASPDIKVCYHILKNRDTEIDSYHDWWGCERRLGRKRIIFTTIGNQKIGMGHVYRSLSLAREFTEHEILFVGDERNSQSTNNMIGYEYIYTVHNSAKITDHILSLSPHLVINDILDTDAPYIQALRNNGISVVNFEDLGSGAPFANVTINELYDTPLISGENIFWGHNYFFLRDEFYNAKQVDFTSKVDSVLLTFGASDPNDYTRKILQLIHPFCQRCGIRILVVIGSGYNFKNELNNEIKLIYPDVECFTGTSAISSIMERSQVAVCSNGRTLYELAQMNIPALVLSHNSRENSHSFVDVAEGFINLGIIDGSKTKETILSSFKRLVTDIELRRSCHQCLSRFDFVSNKLKIVNIIEDVLSKVLISTCP